MPHRFDGRRGVAVAVAVPLKSLLSLKEKTLGVGGGGRLLICPPARTTATTAAAEGQKAQGRGRKDKRKKIR